MGKANTSSTPRLVLGVIFIAGIGGLGFLSMPESVTASDFDVADIAPASPTHRGAKAKTPTLCAGESDTSVREPALVAAPTPLVESRTKSATKVGRTELIVSCSPTSYRLIATRLEKAFERQAPSIDVVLQIRDDRDCVGQVIVDSADVALISGDLSDRERTQKLRESILGYQIVVPVVHPKNPIDSITQLETKPLLEGAHTEWRHLGRDVTGNILPVCRSLPRLEDFASRTLRFQGRASSSAVYLSSAREILAYVANQPHALGLCTWNEAQGERDVKVLEIAHVKPTLDNFLRGAWPLGCAMRIVTVDEPKDAARVFVSYVASREVRRVLARHLVLPH